MRLFEQKKDAFSIAVLIILCFLLFSVFVIVPISMLLYSKNFVGYYSIDAYISIFEYWMIAIIVLIFFICLGYYFIYNTSKSELNERLNKINDELDQKVQHELLNKTIETIITSGSQKLLNKHIADSSDAIITPIIERMRKDMTNDLNSAKQNIINELISFRDDAITKIQTAASNK